MSSAGSEHGAKNTKTGGSVPAQAIQLRVGFMTLVGPFQLRIFCDLVWKRSKLSPAINPALPSPLLNHVPKCHIS